MPACLRLVVVRGSNITHACRRQFSETTFRIPVQFYRESVRENRNVFARAACDSAAPRTFSIAIARTRIRTPRNDSRRSLAPSRIGQKSPVITPIAPVHLHSIRNDNTKRLEALLDANKHKPPTRVSTYFHFFKTNSRLNYQLGKLTSLLTENQKITTEN